MPPRLEADTCVLHVSSGLTAAGEAPGLAVFSAPRKAARGREHDTLFLCLSLRARSPLPAELYAERLDLATQTFFGYPGSVTSALRQALQAVNQSLLTYNLQAAATASGLPAQGGLICAVLRGADLYAVQSGPGMILAAHRTALERFPTLPSRALGLSDQADIQYFHTLVEPEAYFCLCNSVPESWDAQKLKGLGGLSTLTLVLERLKEATTGDFAALVGRFETAASLPVGLPLRPIPGFRPLPQLFPPRPAPPPAAAVPAPPPPTGATPTATPELPIAEPPGEAARRIPVISTLPEAEPGKAQTPEPEFASAEAFAPAPEAASEPEPEASQVAPPPAAPTDWQQLMNRAERLERAEPPSIPVVEDETYTPAVPEAADREPIGVIRRPQPRPASGGPNLGVRLQRGARAFARAIAVTLAESAYNFRKFTARLLPEGILQRDGLFAIPNSVLIGITIIFPLVAVSLAAVFYFQVGQNRLYTDTLNAAMLEVANAGMTTDPVTARHHWENAQQLLEQVRQLRPDTPNVAALWQETQENLDQLDGVTRIDYRQLLANGLGAEAKLAQLLLIGSDVFVLDTGNNRVSHLLQNATGAYQLDTAFACAGGTTIGHYSLGALVAMTVMPAPNLLGTDAILATDQAGQVVYCASGKVQASFLPAPPAGWKSPVALATYAGRLYVLDPGANQIWQYQPSGDAFTDPAPYFTGPERSLQDIVDFTIATGSGEIFLLRKDGRVADCIRRSTTVAPACVEVVQFTDPRAGRGLSEHLWDVNQPSHLVYNPPPEPSLYLLDSGNSGLYRLSLKLELVQFFRPRQALSGPITAVALDASRIYIGAGGNIYVATRP